METIFRSNLSANSQKLRLQMPVVTDYAYFDHAAVSPLTLSARNAIQRWLQQASEIGDVEWMQWHQAAEQTRAFAARLLNATIDEITLVPSTTYGINLVASGLNWKRGNSIVLPENEFPSNSIPWQLLRDRGVDVRTVSAGPQGEISIDEIFKCVDSSTRLISVSWVGYLSGYRIDLAELVDRAHAQGVEVFVDAIQGLGAFALDVKKIPIDYLSADGHKWMLGPEGAGLFYVAARNLEKLTPQMVGWNSVKSASEFKHGTFSIDKLKPTAARFEGGTTNMVGMIGFGASLQVLLDCGCNESEGEFSKSILDHADYACERLRSAGAIVHRDYPREHQSGIVSFQIPDEDPLLIRSRCLEKNVVLSVRHHRLRIAVHGYNNQADVDRLINAIQTRNTGL